MSEPTAITIILIILLGMLLIIACLLIFACVQIVRLAEDALDLQLSVNEIEKKLVRIENE